MNLLQMSLSGAVFILTVMVIRIFAIDRLPKITFRVLWDIALIRLLLPVAFPLPILSAVNKNISVLDILENGIADLTGDILPNQSNIIESNAEQIFQNNIQNSKNNAQIFSVLLIIWGAGTVIMAGFFIVSYFRCQREFQTALPIHNNFISLWLKEHPLWRTIEIRQLTGLSAPLTYGVFHPVILVPKHTNWREERQMQYILFHEYIHIRRFDAIRKFIASIALCIHWFNPLVWLLYLLLNRDIELSCDECVIRRFGRENRKYYAMALLCMEEQRSSPAPFGNYFNKNSTLERIETIMKFKKKTIFALASSIIIIAAGTVAAFVTKPKAADIDFKNILQGNASFLYVSEESVESKTIYEVPALFDPYDTYMKIWAFTVLDLDGDGNTEVILYVNGAANDMGGSLILHQMDGRIYGYTANYRNLIDLKTDGTYSYSDITGLIEGGICSITYFTKTGYTVDKITYGHGTYEGWNSFIVNHKPATEEEFLAAQNKQTEKSNAVWYDFTTENIQSKF